jgi:hypothetical protein
MAPKWRREAVLGQGPRPGVEVVFYPVNGYVFDMTQFMWIKFNKGTTDTLSGPKPWNYRLIVDRVKDAKGKSPVKTPAKLCSRFNLEKKRWRRLIA